MKNHLALYMVQIAVQLRGRLLLGSGFGELEIGGGDLGLGILALEHSAKDKVFQFTHVPWPRIAEQYAYGVLGEAGFREMMAEHAFSNGDDLFPTITQRRHFQPGLPHPLITIATTTSCALQLF